MNSTFLVQVTGIISIGLGIVSISLLLFLGVFWGVQSSKILATPGAYALFMDALRNGLLSLGFSGLAGFCSFLLYWSTIKKEKSE